MPALFCVKVMSATFSNENSFVDISHFFHFKVLIWRSYRLKHAPDWRLLNGDWPKWGRATLFTNFQTPKKPPDDVIGGDALIANWPPFLSLFPESTNSIYTLTFEYLQAFAL